MIHASSSCCVQVCRERSGTPCASGSTSTALWTGGSAVAGASKVFGPQSPFSCQCTSNLGTFLCFLPVRPMPPLNRGIREHLQAGKCWSASRSKMQTWRMLRCRFGRRSRPRTWAHVPKNVPLSSLQPRLRGCAHTFFAESNRRSLGNLRETGFSPKSGKHLDYKNRLKMCLPYHPLAHVGRVYTFYCTQV